MDVCRRIHAVIIAGLMHCVCTAWYNTTACKHFTKHRKNSVRNRSKLQLVHIYERDWSMSEERLSMSLLADIKQG